MVWTSIRKIADAIRNDLVSGLRGYHQNMSLSIEQLEEEIVQLRLAVIKEYMLKGILPVDDLITSLNCIPVDCDYLDKCSCGQGSNCSKPTAHFAIPQILMDYGLKKAIKYIGSSDKQHPFLIYTQPLYQINQYQKYRKRGREKPYVYIDVSPNKDGMIDCYIFGAPLIKQVSVVAIFKDPRQLEEYNCGCDGEDTQLDNNYNFIDTIVKDRLTQQKLRYYRQFAAPIKPNDQEYNPG